MPHTGTHTHMRRLLFDISWRHLRLSHSPKGHDVTFAPPAIIKNQAGPRHRHEHTMRIVIVELNCVWGVLGARWGAQRAVRQAGRQGRGLPHCLCLASCPTPAPAPHRVDFIGLIAKAPHTPSLHTPKRHFDMLWHCHAPTHTHAHSASCLLLTLIAPATWHHYKAASHAKLCEIWWAACGIVVRRTQFANFCSQLHRLQVPCPLSPRPPHPCSPHPPPAHAQPRYFWCASA